MTPTQYLITNAQYLCKKNKIKIQDFEYDIGYRPGHLATMFRKGTEIGLDTAVKISKIFGVPISDMISCDIQKLERIRELEKELDKLKKESEEK